jgi:aminoglycoside 6'-N-acetyltransferase I
MPIEIRVLRADDAEVLDSVASDVFDGPVEQRWSSEFLADERHHLAVALDAGCVVGMASAVHYVHPDKAPELWVNEVGVADAYQSQGIGLRLLEALFAHGRTLGCSEAWVLTEESNTAARRLYARAGGVESAALMYSFPLDTQK